MTSTDTGYKAPETRTIYVRGPGGEISEITSDEADISIPAGGEVITAEQYEAELAELRRGRDTYVAGLLAADAERTRGDFEALTALGVPEATARRLSGYEPDYGGA